MVTQLKRLTPGSFLRFGQRELRKIWNRRWMLVEPTVPFLKSRSENFHLDFPALPDRIQTRSIADAEAVLRGHRECFGTVTFTGERHPWDADVLSGHVWPSGRFYQNYKVVDIADQSDVKVPWELSRCHHLVTLAKAYRLTGNDIYASEVLREIQGWIDANPFAASVNWTCAMEAAIRSVNWIWALRICGPYIHNHEKIVATINDSLFRHGVFIRGNLEKNTNGFSSNHYYSDLVGLLYIGLYFRRTGSTGRWFDFALQELYKETLLQFYPSGPHYELSTAYHRLVTEMLLSVLVQLKHEGILIPIHVLDRAERAVDYISAYTRPDGTVPLIGDADDGRLHILGPYCQWNRLSHEHLLAIGHVFFSNDRFRLERSDHYEEAAYHLESAHVFDLASSVPMPRGSAAFPDAGMYCMRNGPHFALIKLSNLGVFESAGWHTHNDVLSFDLTLGGAPLIVDPGVGNYSGDVKERNMFRSTRMHNTVMIDDIEQNSIRGDEAGLWTNGGEAKPVQESWISKSDEDILQGFHRGYMRLPSPIIHRRSFRLKKAEGIFEVRDSFEGAGDHRAEWNFVLHPGVIPRELSRNTWRLETASQVALCESEVALEPIESWFSPGYRRKIQTWTLRGSSRVNSSVQITVRFSAK